MENSNCTFYMDGNAVRGKLGYVSEYGHSVTISAQECLKYTSYEIPPGTRSVAIPGVQSYLIAIDDSVTTVTEVVSNMDLTIDSIESIEHDVAEWQWRNPDARCLDCGSANYRAMGHDVYRCNDCDKVFGVEKQEAPKPSAELAAKTQAQFNSDGEWTGPWEHGIEAYFRRLHGDK